MPPGDLFLLPLLWVQGEHKHSKLVNILPQHPCNMLPAVRHDQRLLYHYSLEKLA